MKTIDKAKGAATNQLPIPQFTHEATGCEVRAIGIPLLGKWTVTVSQDEYTRHSLRGFHDSEREAIDAGVRWIEEMYAPLTEDGRMAWDEEPRAFHGLAACGAA